MHKDSGFFICIHPITVTIAPNEYATYLIGFYKLDGSLSKMVKLARPMASFEWMDGKTEELP